MPPSDHCDASLARRLGCITRHLGCITRRLGCITRRLVCGREAEQAFLEAD